jgi:thiol-disulfide isomerase/thioredoxin
MPERVILLIAIVTVVMLAVLAVRRFNARGIERLKKNGPAWHALGAQPDGRRTVIAFSTPSCAACHASQLPAINLAAKQLGEHAVRVIRVDASQQPDAARAFGVHTVPSTVVLAADGDQIVAVNQGFTPSRRLVEQLQRAS